MKKWTEEEKTFIILNAEKYKINDLTRLFNERFSHNKTNNAVQIKVNLLGKRIMCSHHHVFSEEEIEWLKEIYINTLTPNKKIAEMFNEKFNPKDKMITKYNVNDLLTKRLKMKRGRNAGQYGQGEKRKTHSKIGSLMARKQGSRNYLYIKTSIENVKKTRSGTNDYYMPLQKYIYEKENGKLKDGEFVIFADGNNRNFELKNLVKVNQKINGSLTMKQVQSAGVLTKAWVEIKNTELIMDDISEAISILESESK